MKKQKQKNRALQDKLVLGITGSFGSGKSTVAKMFGRHGAVIIDADKICHQLLEPGKKVYLKVIKAFGVDKLGSDKKIDRAKLSREVFKEKSKIFRLNKIVHPEAARIIKKKIAKCQKGLIVLDAPLLIEAGLDKIVDGVIAVNIKRKKQLARLIRKVELSKKDILKRISRQMPLKEKVRLADFIIDNNGSIKNTRKQVELIMLQLCSGFFLKHAERAKRVEGGVKLWRN